MKDNWIPIDDPEATARWAKEQRVGALREEFARAANFVDEAILLLPDEEVAKDIEDAMRIMRQIVDEIRDRDGRPRDAR